MVLPPSASIAARREGVSDWIDEVRQAIDLHRRGMLLLVDHAVLEKLGELVRGVLRTHPNAEVVTSPEQLPTLPDGSVVVYLPRAEHAFWLNVNRPLFARKCLKVVLFSTRAVTEVLAREAVDFYDWIAQRIDCPAGHGVAEHAVLGIRQALRCRAPGIAYTYRENERLDESLRIERFERLFHAALPGRTLQWIDARTPYRSMVERIAGAGRAWVACDTRGREDAARFRWALAEARRKTRAVLLVPYFYEDSFWHVSDALVDDLDKESKWLENAGAKHPLRLLAASGLEWLLVLDIVGLLARDYREEEILACMLEASDPGAGLAPLVLRAGMEPFPVQGFFMSPHLQRYLGKRTALRRSYPAKPRRKVDGIEFDDAMGGGRFPLLREDALRIEFLLGQRDRSPERWLHWSKLALDRRDYDVAATWARRSLEKRQTSAAYFVFGVALAALGQINDKYRHPVGLRMRSEALQSLQEAERNLDPGTAPEDLLTLYAVLAALYQEFRMADAEWTVERAAMLVDVPHARARDLRRVADVLMQRGQTDRAEVILSMALGKTRELEERAEIRLGLVKCVLAQKRIEEADAMAEALRKDLEPHRHSALNALIVHMEGVQIQIRLQQQRFQDAVVLADEFVRYASPVLFRVYDEAIDRIPWLAQALARAGRAADAIVLLRRMFNLPLVESLELRFKGLKSRKALEAFVSDPVPRIDVHPQSRPSLWVELIQATRSQGRHAEADELERSGPPVVTE